MQQGNFFSSQKPGWFESMLHSWSVCAEDILFALHHTSFMCSLKRPALGRLSGQEGKWQEGHVGNAMPGQWAPRAPFCS